MFFQVVKIAQFITKINLINQPLLSELVSSIMNQQNQSVLQSVRQTVNERACQSSLNNSVYPSVCSSEYLTLTKPWTFTRMQAFST
jgi:hypothetical protein